jgi:hypothetical protein
MFNQFNWAEATWQSPVFIALVHCSIVTFGAVLERLYYYHKRRGNPDDMLRKVSVKIREGQTREAAVLCETTTLPVGPVAADILETPSIRRQFLRRLHSLSAGKASSAKLEHSRNDGRQVSPAGLLGTSGDHGFVLRHGEDRFVAPARGRLRISRTLVTAVAGL